MNPKDKKQLFISLAIAGVLLLIAIVALSATDNEGGFIRFNSFELIWNVIKLSFEFFWGFLWMFGALFWTLLSTQWEFGFIIVACIALVVLRRMYDRSEK